MTQGPCAAAEPFRVVKGRCRMWPRLLPSAMLSSWIWGDARGGFQRKVFLGSGGGIPGLSLTLPAEMCQRGARLKNHTHHPFKKRNKKPQKTPHHQKTTTTATKPKSYLSFTRARNTTKLRSRWQLLSAFIPRSTHSQEPPAQPALLVSQLSQLGLGAGRTPWVHSPQQRGTFGSPKREICPAVRLAGLHFPWLCADLSKPGPVKSHVLGRHSEPPP